MPMQEPCNAVTFILSLCHLLALIDYAMNSFVLLFTNLRQWWLDWFVNLVLSVICSESLFFVLYTKVTQYVSLDQLAHAFLAPVDSGISLIKWPYVLFSFNIFPFLLIHILLNSSSLVISSESLTLPSLTSQINGSAEFFTYHPQIILHFEQSYRS